jgi:hypothetical protein
VKASHNVVAVAATALLAGCSAAPAPHPTPTPTGTARCPVTQPGRFVPPSGVPESALFGAGSSYGNGRLWVGGLPDNGVVVAGSDLVDPDRFGIKLGWYRVTAGLLTIAGRRLDASAPPARASVPSGYGDTGFQASGVSFPTEGCWEISGTVGSTTLTFVMLVTKA